MYENDQKQERIVWVDGTLEAIHWGIEDEIKKPNGLCDVYKEMGYLPLAEIKSVVSAVSTSNVSAAFEKALSIVFMYHELITFRLCSPYISRGGRENSQLRTRSSECRSARQMVTCSSCACQHR